MNRRLSIAVALLLGGATCALNAQSVATVEVSAYPAVALADGRSTVTISATVRDRSGSYLPNGTQVAFSTSLGNFQDPVIAVAAGVARATLVAPNLVGKATVTVSVVNFAAVATTTVEFVSDASKIVKSSMFVEADGASYLAYASDIQTIRATGKDHGARISYRDVVIEADDIELDVAQMHAIATNATLRVSGGKLEASQLNYKLMEKRGTAAVALDGRVRLVAVKGTEPLPLKRDEDKDEFRFRQLMDSMTIVLAKHITAQPGREVLFKNATVFVGGSRMISLPHYVVDPSKQGGILNMEAFGINQDGLTVDVPYYVALGPRESSSLRLRSQYYGGQTYASSRGMSLDWVTKYADSDKYSGDFTVTEISGQHWGMTFRHSQRLSKTLNGYLVLDSPQHQALTGVGQLSQQFRGFYANLSVSGTQGFREGLLNDRRSDLTFDTNSSPLLGRSLYQSFGVTSSYEELSGSSSQDAVREAAGLRYRLRTTPFRIGPASLGASTTLSRLWGRNAGDGIGMLATLTSSLPLGARSSLALSYDYTQAQLSSALLGKHRLSANLSGGLGPINGTAYLTRSLDARYGTLLLESSLRLSKVWRIGYSFTRDEYLTSRFSDYSVLLGFNMGIREIGIRWSYLTRRFGIELNAATW